MGDALRGLAKGKGAAAAETQQPTTAVLMALNRQRRPWDSLIGVVGYPPPGHPPFPLPRRGETEGGERFPRRGSGGKDNDLAARRNRSSQILPDWSPHS